MCSRWMKKCLYYVFCCCFVKCLLNACQYLMDWCDTSDEEDGKGNQRKNEERKMSDELDENSSQSINIPQQSARDLFQERYKMIKKGEDTIQLYDTLDLMQYKGFLMRSYPKDLTHIEEVDDLLAWRKQSQMTIFQRAQLWWKAFIKFYINLWLIFGCGFYTCFKINVSNSQIKGWLYGATVSISFFLLFLNILLIFPKRKINAFREDRKCCC